MTAAVQRLLNSFDALSEADKQEAAVQVIRRVSRATPAVLPDEALVAAAEELFLDLDAREQTDAER